MFHSYRINTKCEIRLTGDELEGVQKGRFVLPTLAFTRFISGMPNVLIGVLLIEIAESFNTSVGVAGQIRTATSILAFFSALILGGLSVKYNPKTLLVTGIASLFISATLSSNASSFLMLLAFYPLNGIGIVLVNPMGAALVGEYYSDEERASAVGWLVSGGSLAWVVGAQAITYLAGKRNPGVIFASPVSQP